ncbi:hypothetical protein COSO111634_32945 [Corallococcus soli]
MGRSGQAGDRKFDVRSDAPEHQLQVGLRQRNLGHPARADVQRRHGLHQSGNDLRQGLFHGPGQQVHSVQFQRDGIERGG